MLTLTQLLVLYVFSLGSCRRRFVLTITFNITECIMKTASSTDQYSQSISQYNPSVPHHQPPSAYTGELFSVEYLYVQSGHSFSPTEEELDEQADKGFGEEEPEELDESFVVPVCFSHSVSLSGSLS